MIIVNLCFQSYSSRSLKLRKFCAHLHVCMRFDIVMCCLADVVNDDN